MQLKAGESDPIAAMKILCFFGVHARETRWIPHFLTPECNRVNEWECVEWCAACGKTFRTLARNERGPMP